jgi:hypothetical protein
MANFDLPDFNPNAKPEFTDSNACAAWLQTLPLINVGPSHGRLLGQLAELNGFEVPPAERLKILELLRGPVAFVQTEHAKKFGSRPAPLSRPEREIFKNVKALWDALSLGYQHCLQAIAGGDSGMNGLVALICQRVLWCTGQKMSNYYEAYQDLEDADWTLLHRVYAFAEERDVADDEVGHPTHQGKVETSCIETYAQVLLLNLANPNEQGPRQIALISRWLERWARRVSIARAPRAAGNGAAQLVVDLASGTGASRRPATGDSIRYIEIGGIGKSVRKRVALLRQGESPVSLRLGDDVAASVAESLLVMLYRRWCEDGQTRVQPRRSASGTAQVCSGMSAVHFCVTGRPFQPRGESKGLAKVPREEIATFGRVADPQLNDQSAAQHHALETWQINEESLSGFRLERLDPAANSRLVLNQLVAVRPADAKGFLLCVVRWLSVSAEFELRVGVRTLPGMPVGVTIRAGGVNAPAESNVPALMLPAVAALQAPDTLVLPIGWFRPKRVIEVFTDRAHQMVLSAVIERGADFERVSFDPL